MGVLNLSGFVNLKWNNRSVVATVIAIVVAGYVVLWHYWCGRNWARIVVIIVSVIAVFDLVFILFPYKTAVLYDSIVILEALLGLFLLYWLNLKDVRTWFKQTEDSRLRDLVER